jgi:hypothetical protein
MYTLPLGYTDEPHSLKYISDEPRAKIEIALHLGTVYTAHDLDRNNITKEKRKPCLNSLSPPKVKLKTNTGTIPDDIYDSV